MRPWKFLIDAKSVQQRNASKVFFGTSGLEVCGIKSWRSVLANEDAAASIRLG